MPNVQLNFQSTPLMVLVRHEYHGERTLEFCCLRKSGAPHRRFLSLFARLHSNLFSYSLNILLLPLPIYTTINCISHSDLMNTFWMIASVSCWLACWWAYTFWVSTLVGFLQPSQDGILQRRLRCRHQWYMAGWVAAASMLSQGPQTQLKTRNRGRHHCEQLVYYLLRSVTTITVIFLHKHFKFSITVFNRVACSLMAATIANKHCWLTTPSLVQQVCRLR